MMASIIQSGGSIDTAIRSIAEEGPPLSKEIFLNVVRTTDSRGAESLTSELNRVLSQLPREASGYGRSVMMVISASESVGDEIRDRMLRDASDIALDSVHELGESYGASLALPCMAIFGIGIMVPMILMSILPMLSLGGAFGTVSISDNVLMTITLVIVPVIILMVVMMIRSGNPFLTSVKNVPDIRIFIPLMCSIPLAIAYISIYGISDDIFLYCVVPTCAITAFTKHDIIHNENARRHQESAVKDIVFDVGNRMLSGYNFERAAVEAMATNDGCSELSHDLEREFALCRGDVESAFRNALEPVSHDASVAFCNILRSSEKDTHDAGHMASTLGKQFRDLSSTKRELELKLKSTTDMMMGTAMVFAPLILGMSVAMLEPLSKLGDMASLEGSTMIMNVYLIELSALISILVSSLGSDDGYERMLWRFCIICPISLIVFAIVCSIGL